MALISDGNGGMEVGPPPEDDPVRQDHARRVAAFAFELELQVQESESRDAQQAQNEARLSALESRLAMLEQLLLGPGRAA